MATIGTLTKSENGFSGLIKTVRLRKFGPAEKDNDKAPDCRIFTGPTDCNEILVWGRCRPFSKIVCVTGCYLARRSERFELLI